jgi:hypothetical protein
LFAKYHPVRPLADTTDDASRPIVRGGFVDITTPHPPLSSGFYCFYKKFPQEGEKIRGKKHSKIPGSNNPNPFVKGVK